MCPVSTRTDSSQEILLITHQRLSTPTLNHPEFNVLLKRVISLSLEILSLHLMSTTDCSFVSNQTSAIVEFTEKSGKRRQRQRGRDSSGNRCNNQLTGQPDNSYFVSLMLLAGSTFNIPPSSSWELACFKNRFFL